MDYNPLLAAMIMTHIRDDCEENELVEQLRCMSGPEEVFLHAEFLKDKGNTLFRRGDVDLAFEAYENAAKLLSCTLPSCDENRYRDLALSINLNLAACTIKMKQFERARALCSLVLDFDSRNVKVRFRRAVANLELGLVVESSWDLEKVLEIEPKNKDAMRELEKAKSLISQKRKSSLSSGQDSPGQDRKGKKLLGRVQEEVSISANPIQRKENAVSDICVAVSECSSLEGCGSSKYEVRLGPLDSEKGGCSPDVDSSSVLSGISCVTESENTKVNLGMVDPDFKDDERTPLRPFGYEETRCNPHEDDSSIVDVEFEDASSVVGRATSKPKLHFFNRQNRASALSISSSLYERITEGKEVMFYQLGSTSFMKIRVRHKVQRPSLVTQSSSQDPSKEWEDCPGRHVDESDPSNLEFSSSHIVQPRDQEMTDSKNESSLEIPSQEEGEVNSKRVVDKAGLLFSSKPKTRSRIAKKNVTSTFSPCKCFSPPKQIRDPKKRNRYLVLANKRCVHRFLSGIKRKSYPIREDGSQDPPPKRIAFTHSGHCCSTVCKVNAFANPYLGSSSQPCA